MEETDIEKVTLCKYFSKYNSTFCIDFSVSGRVNTSDLYKFTFTSQLWAFPNILYPSLDEFKYLMFILFMLSPDFHLCADTLIEILVDILVLFDKC